MRGGFVIGRNMGQFADMPSWQDQTGGDRNAVVVMQVVPAFALESVA
jgi:hypothetical protein